MPWQGFREVLAHAAPLPEGETLAFDALPRRYAVRSLYERHFAHPVALPEPVAIAFREFLQPAAKLDIQCSSAVVNEIRMRAAEGFQRIRHGGIEVGAALFGTHFDGVVRIEAVRPMACDYANGSRFVLSKHDEMALADMLLASSTDPDLAGLEAAGWYHSHTREEICLTPDDVEAFDRFIPAAWQVALVVRPANLAPTRAGFFFREENGAIRTESSYQEFELGLEVTWQPRRAAGV